MLVAWKRLIFRLVNESKHLSQIFYFNTLRARVEEEIAKESERICGGYADFNVYREQVGYLRGLKAALTLMEDIEKGLT